ncbi:MAG: hypothetical protein ACD_60C00007G0017 [uncultured bacterium]|nr:MAG: hypothetical protein ACD_60C00007G0017 [uncultured bacterium]
MHQIRIIVVFISTILAGCMVGPDFHSPASPKTNHYTYSPLPKKTISTSKTGTSGKAQQFVFGKDIPAEWWYLFHSSDINQLIIKGLANSPNLISAKATLRQAEETLRAQIGALMFPNVSAQLGAQRQYFSPATLGSSSSSSLFNLYNASVNVSYTPDVFGGSRRQIEALRAEVDYERYELAAAYLTLTSNIVTTAITTASLQAQIQTTKDLIRYQRELLVITKQQYKVGAVSLANVFTQETQLAQTEASLPPLQQSLSQSNHALAVLVGELPSENRPLKLDLTKLQLPSKLPVSLPSSLVRQRPDVLSSEALLWEASAQIGVATAALFPQITLSGAYGWTDTSLSNFFSPHNHVWDYGGSLTQPIFNAGSLRAKRRAAVAAYDAAYAQYRQTVLQAFQNVADSLRAIQHDAETLRAQKNAEASAKQSFLLTGSQYRLGGVDYLNLLTAEVQYQQAKIALIQAQASRYNDTAALFQALGGGWWHNCLDI